MNDTGPGRLIGTIPNLQSLHEPLFCDGIRTTMDFTEAVCEPAVLKYVDPATCILNLENIQSVVRDKPITPATLNEEVVHLMPFVRTLAVQCHLVAKSPDFVPKLQKMELWASCELCNLLSENASDRFLSLITATATIEWVVSCLVERRLQLKDNLMSLELGFREDLTILVPILQSLVGCVKGFNLKNLVWHGFGSTTNIPPEVTSLVFCVVITLDNILSQSIVTQRKKGVLKCNSSFEVDYPNPDLTICKDIIKQSAIIHPDHLELWNKLLSRCPRLWCREQVALDRITLVSLNVTLLQHCLRRLWVTLTCPEDTSRCSAQDSEFYITLDEMFSPSSRPEVSRPGASYFSTVYTEQKSPQSDNVFIGVLGEGAFYALLDLFVLGDGPRLRDELSHCQLRDLNDNVCKHVLYLSIVVLSKFCSDNAQMANLYHDIFDNYQLKFHPLISMIIPGLKQSKSNVESLFQFQFECLEGLEIDDVVPETLSVLIQILTELEECKSVNITPHLYIGPHKMKYYSMITEAVKCFTLSTKNLKTVLNDKYVAFKSRTLRSRQRKTFSVLVTSLTCILNSFNLLQSIFCLLLGRIEDLSCYDFNSNKSLVGILKGIVKLNENISVYVSKCNWHDMLNSLTKFFVEFKELYNETV